MKKILAGLFAYIFLSLLISLMCFGCNEIIGKETTKHDILEMLAAGFLTTAFIGLLMGGVLLFDKAMNAIFYKS